MSSEYGNDGVRMFGKAAISGAVLINSGALIAVLSQLSKLGEVVELNAIQSAFTYWGLGLAVATFVFFQA